MGTQEWILLALVLVIPLIIAVAVTLWTLEQAIKRNKRNQPNRRVRRIAEPVTESGTGDSADSPGDNHGEHASVGVGSNLDDRCGGGGDTSDGGPSDGGGSD